MLYFAPWKIVLILLVIATGLMGVFPNFINTETLEENWPSFIPGKQLVLGLDLQGGSYLLFEVDKEDYQKQQVKRLVGEIRNTLTEAPRIGYIGLAPLDDSAQVRIRDSEKIEEAIETITRSS